jgi:hypothetical protein
MPAFALARRDVLWLQVTSPLASTKGFYGSSAKSARSQGVEFSLWL